MTREQALKLWKEVSCGAPDGVATDRTLEAFANAVEAAMLERMVKWYSEHGWLLDEDDVPGAMRAIFLKA